MNNSRKALLYGSLIFASIVFLIFSGSLYAQDEENKADFWLSEEFLNTLIQNKGDVWRTKVRLSHVSSIKQLPCDCEIHAAGSPSITQPFANPPFIVAEPPNVCMNKPPSGKYWKTYFTKKLIDEDGELECEVEGFPRIYTEHADAGGTAVAATSNPDHILEIHPLLSIECPGSPKVDFRSFLKYHPGMKSVKPETAQCLVGGNDTQEKRGLFVRSAKNPLNEAQDGYEFQQRGCAMTGNFTILEVTSIDFVRAINGGHSAIARVFFGCLEEDDERCFGPFTLKLYTLDGTPEDQVLRDIDAGQLVGYRSYWHGMFSYDYFSMQRIVKPQNSGFKNINEWTEVKFPLALLVFGEADLQEIRSLNPNKSIYINAYPKCN